MDGCFIHLGKASLITVSEISRARRLRALLLKKKDIMKRSD